MSMSHPLIHALYIYVDTCYDKGMANVHSLGFFIVWLSQHGHIFALRFNQFCPVTCGRRQSSWKTARKMATSGSTRGEVHGMGRSTWRVRSARRSTSWKKGALFQRPYFTLPDKLGFFVFISFVEVVIGRYLGPNDEESSKIGMGATKWTDDVRLLFV